MESNNPNIKPKGRLLTYIVIIIVIVAIVGGGVGYYLSTIHKPSEETITVAAPVYSSSPADWENYLNTSMSSWLHAHPNVKIKFVGPFGASSEGQYYSKLDLMTSASSTSPDIMLEDMFYTATYAASHTIEPLNSYINKSYFSNIYPAAIDQMEINGAYYGIPAQVTDTLIYYNITLLREANVIGPTATSWQPTTWQQIINAALKVKANDSNVIPLNVYEGVKADEASSFTGFEGLLYGTGWGLYNFSDNKWYGYNPGLNATLNFYDTVFVQDHLADYELSAIPYITVGQYMQEGKLAIAIDGSWMYGYQWAPGDAHAISNFSKYIGVAAIPTEYGQAPGFVTMTGGWGWAMSTYASNKPLVASFMESLGNATNQVLINLPTEALAGGLPTAKNSSSVPAFSKLMPTDPSLDTFYFSLLKYGEFRPPVSGYPTVSTDLQTAMSDVVHSTTSVSGALSAYDNALITAFGSSNVQVVNAPATIVPSITTSSALNHSVIPYDIAYNLHSYLSAFGSLMNAFHVSMIMPTTGMSVPKL